MRNTIFFSYRRADGGWAADLLFNRLGDAFGDEMIFRDIDAITAGDDWKDVISKSLQKCHVFLAVIGPNWTGTQSDNSPPKIFEERDYVRAEIEVALARKIRTIPVLLDPAKLPLPETLPPSISALTSRQHVTIFPGQDFELGFQKLVQAILSELPKDQRNSLQRRAELARLPEKHYRRFGNFLLWMSINIVVLLLVIVLPRRFRPEDSTRVKYLSKSNDFLPQITNLVGSSKDTIWFFGTNFHITATDRKEDILKALERGVHVRFLVIDPDSPDMLFKQLAADFTQSEVTLKSECALGIAALREIKKAWDQRRPLVNSTATFEVRTYVHYPWARMYCFDPKAPEGTTFLIPYIDASNSPDLPGFLFKNTPDGIANEYYAAMVRIWNGDGTKPME